MTHPTATTVRRDIRPARIAGWLLALTLVLPSLVGWLQMPMRANAAALAQIAGAAERTNLDRGSQMTRLLADLAVLCTPYGLQLGGKQDQPGDPARKSGHTNCVLCTIASGTALGVLQASPALPPSQIAIGTDFDASAASPPPAGRIGDWPPGQGPPN